MELARAIRQHVRAWVIPLAIMGVRVSIIVEGIIYIYLVLHYNFGCIIKTNIQSSLIFNLRN